MLRCPSPPPLPTLDLTSALRTSCNLRFTPDKKARTGSGSVHPYPSETGELAELREDLSTMRMQNASLKDELAALKAESAK